LFVPSGPDPEKLEVTIARLAKLVGEGNLGCAELLDSHRPESFCMTRFVAAAEQKKQRQKSEPKIRENSDAHPTVTALRVMRPAQPIRVELRDEQPIRVYLQGMRGDVVAASGPWRSSGDWWQEDAWHQDEWDLEIEFPARSFVVAQHAAPVTRLGKSERSSNQQSSTSPQRGLYRIYYDALRQGWFLRGVYD
jgi:protein ImuB